MITHHVRTRCHATLTSILMHLKRFEKAREIRPDCANAQENREIALKLKGD